MFVNNVLFSILVLKDIINLVDKVLKYELNLNQLADKENLVIKGRLKDQILRNQ